MRITKQQTERNRARVIAQATRLFREKGFDGVGVAELMRAAGLTHGGFYNHFESKRDLETAACAEIFKGAEKVIGAVAAPPTEAARREALDAYRRRYLSPRSRDAASAACPMVAFASDASRQADQVRRAYGAGLRRYIERFAEALRKDAAGAGDPAAERRRAIATLATLVGALSLARGVAKADPELSDEILRAALAELEAAAP